MPTAAKTILIILLLPFLAGLGHDVYINYFSDNEKIKEIKRLQVDPEAFLPSDLGWVWGEYHPASMNMMRDMIEPEVWKEKLDPLLQKPTILVAIVPFAVGVVFLLLTFILGVWPFSRFGQMRKEKDVDYAVYKNAKENAKKYSRK